MTPRSLTEAAFDGKTVLLRLDLNVPVKDGKVVDDFRITQSLETVNYILSHGAKIVMFSHFENKEDMSLRPVYEYLKAHFNVIFVQECLGDGKKDIQNLEHGGIALLENLRLNPGEKANDDTFAKGLASLGDLYVNEAFSASHRSHASIVGVPKYVPGYLGFQFQREIENLSQCFNPPRPFTFILGGAKFDTKLPLVQKFLPIADTIFIAGALANDFYKAKGYSIGQSLVSDAPLDLSALLQNPKIRLPIDVTVKGPNGISQKKPDSLAADESILDCGDGTLKELSTLVSSSACVLWNGPLGNYENGFTKQTTDLAQAIAESGKKSIVGGGDTLAAIASLNLQDKFSFISTGGGAMLDYLAQETLPGLEALKNTP